MASTSIQNVSQGKYDVFLSFRGEDTRKSFTDHLSAALKNKRIYVFRDDKELQKGVSISPGLLKAIEESRISVIVLSKNYASSTWCLDELVKIVECKNREDQIFPIFYDVEPTVVRKQTASFGEAFAKHEKVFRNNVEKVQKWRDALKVVANKSGWELKDRNESEFIEEIVNVISSKIHTEPKTVKELVGIESRLEKLRFLMGTGSTDVRMIGIWGMGGLGKTTLARVVYDLISHEFYASSFLADVRERFEKEGSVISLQKQLLSNLLKLGDISIWHVDDGINIIGSRLRQQKVLLVIDDVADVEQLQSLAGKRDWFGLGSRILITTRDKQLLVAHEVDEEHILNLDVLNDDEALQLFSMKAFKSHQPVEEYVELSKRVLNYASGLPLALKVLGSFLIGRSVDQWRSALERLKRDPSNKIMSILQISFDGLQDSEKKIFLDVACFFKQKNRDYVTKILEGCGFFPVIGIEVLIERSLLTVDDYNTLGMHDLLQELGQLIVTRQSPEEPGKRSRLWRQEEVRHVLTKNAGSEVVEGMIIDVHFFLKNEVRLSAKAFSLMTNLRFLNIGNVQLPEGLEYLSNKLRLLNWHRYPLKSLPSNLQLDKIVEFQMCYSHIEELWKGIKPLNTLKVMKLSHSENLIKTPNFIEVPNLEVLDLKGCTSLREIHSSLLRHNKLILLNLKGCTSLTTLPGEIFMKSLKTLVLSGCLKLRKFPHVGGSMECLQELFLDETNIKEMPLSIEHLSGLVQLTLKDCKNLSSLPVTISSLKCLRTLKLSGCSKLKKFPAIVASMEDLSELYLDGTYITEVPSSIELLTGLELLNLNDCKNLVRLPNSINGLKSLKTLNLSGCCKLENVPDTLGQVESLEELDISGTATRRPPSSIFLMKNLKTLSFSGCNGPPSTASCHLNLPFNLMRKSSCPVALMLPSLSGLCSLSKLDLGDCGLREGAILSDICNLHSLKELYLSGNNFVTLPASISGLFNLKYLELEDCKRLQSLPQLPPNVIKVSVNGCASLLTLLGALKLRKSSWTTIYCIDSLKLLEKNDLAISMLREHLEAVSDSDRNLSIVVPGSEIPKWFMYQNEGSSITVTRPSYLYNVNKVVGYAVCCVFHVPKHSTGITGWRGRSDPIYMLDCSMDGSNGRHVIEFREKFGHRGSDHLWLLFLSRYKHYKNNWLFESHHFKLSFTDGLVLNLLTGSGTGLKVKRCGFHPVYKQKVEEFDETTKQWTHFTSYNLNQFHCDFVGSNMEVATTSKLSLAENAGAAEASGSGCCDDD
ncbi:ADP-ribosyl cyclase/cyclic ADP-ribose hydrolase [Citrus sinensis]|uniref:ADP-ribosyl cyclase/cyclic ADP-ribose hydrolase n=1 Tax=Citrus sinensis TaxID=2711 RepID=A0ACB8JA46_CITSI|nr:ADP-ribosyl cyclase/cyclic ADP-ribose hydrolase [Citrus sinensis]